MAITVRDADLQHDRAELIRFMHENLPAEASDPSRFDWLYLENPEGQARAWMARDEAGRTIGVAAAFPRCFSIGGRPERGWVLGDFCISREYRSLGPALLLQRTSLQSLLGDERTFCYDFPSSSMVPIYQRLGVPILGRHVRYVKLLRTDEKVLQFVKQPVLARHISRVGNWALAFQRFRQSAPADIECFMLQGPFGDEFNSLSSRRSCLHAVEGLRTADYLNWRYVHHPLKHYCVVVARRQSALLGYGIVEIEGRHSMLADVHTIDAERIVPAILAGIESILRDMEICSINAPVFEDCHLVPLLRRSGFRPRESAPVVAHAHSSAKWPADIRDAKNWFLLYGDRDS